MKTSNLFLLAAAMVLVRLPITRVSAAAEPGEPAPNFTLMDIEGRPHALADYRGKTVVLEWNNPDCPIVRKHYESGNIPRLQREMMAQGVIWLLINSGAPGRQGGDYTAGELKRWLREHQAAPTAYLRDQDGKVGHLYGAKTTPHMFVIDPAGVLVYEGAIDSIPSARKSDIPRATNYVRAALLALKEGRPVSPTATRAYGCSVKYGSQD